MLISQRLLPFQSCALLTLMLCTFMGCNGGSEPAPPADSSNAQSVDSSQSSGPNSTSAEVTSDPQGRKSIDGIPYDVFFDDPLAVVAQHGTIAQPQVVATPSITPSETPSESTNDPDPKPATEEPQAASVNWDEIIPMELLDNEIKSIRNFLTPTLQSVGTYNREFKQIPMQGNTMAALAQIALSHSGDALWKDQAAALRDLSYKLANSAEAPGRAGWQASSLEFENLLQIFDGSEPTLETEPDPDAPFSDHADRGPLMRRMEVAYNWLSSNTPTPAAFEDVKEKALHETLVLGALTKVTGDESYLYADEPDYMNHINEMISAIDQMRKAIEDNNHDSFREGVSAINKKCAECHTDYRE